MLLRDFIYNRGKKSSYGDASTETEDITHHPPHEISEDDNRVTLCRLLSGIQNKSRQSCFLLYLNRSAQRAVQKQSMIFAKYRGEKTFVKQRF